MRAARLQRFHSGGRLRLLEPKLHQRRSGSIPPISRAPLWLAMHSPRKAAIINLYLGLDCALEGHKSDSSPSYLNCRKIHITLIDPGRPILNERYGLIAAVNLRLARHWLTNRKLVSNHTCMGCLGLALPRSLQSCSHLRDACTLMLRDGQVRPR